MRWTLVLAVALLAGCASQAPPSVPVVEPPGSALPDDFMVNGTVPPTLSVYGDTARPCESLPPSECQRFPFAVPRTVTVTAFMEWDATVEDVDLFLFEGDQVVVASDRRYGPEFIRETIDSGDYEFAVRGGRETKGTAFALRVWFDEPRAPNP